MIAYTGRYRDSRLREIQPGQRVAYNRSGNVIEGTVLEVRSSYVLIEPHEDFLSPRSSWPAESRVKCGTSILVLE